MAISQPPRIQLRFTQPGSDADIRLGADKSIMRALYKGLIAAAIVAILLFSLLVQDIRLLASAIIGVLISLALFAITEYYTSKRYSPVRGIAAAGRRRRDVLGMTSTRHPGESWYPERTCTGPRPPPG